MKSILKTINLDKIILDNKNPRLKFSQIEKNIKKWTDETSSEEIKNALVFDGLLNSIEEYGVMDPIWVHDLGNGNFRVIEGNMRVTVLRELNQRKITSSKIQYNQVKAHIIAKNTSDVEIETHKAVLQTGKNPWGSFNEAAHIYNLFSKNKIFPDKIAIMLGKSKNYVMNEIDNYKFYLEFIKFRKSKGDDDVAPTKYSFFKDAPISVKQVFFQNSNSRKQYFELISPNKAGITKIPNVSLKGGLRTFGKFVDDKRTLNRFLKDTKLTVDDAYLEYREKNFLIKQSWVKKLPSMINSMNKLNKFDREKALENPEIKDNLKKLQTTLKRFI